MKEWALNLTLFIAYPVDSKVQVQGQELTGALETKNYQVLVYRLMSTLVRKCLRMIFPIIGHFVFMLAWNCTTSASRGLAGYPGLMKSKDNAKALAFSWGGRGEEEGTCQLQATALLWEDESTHCLD